MRAAYLMKQISGDIPLTRREKLRYLAINGIRGVAGYACPLRSVFWQCNGVEEGTESPGRKYLNRWLSTELSKIAPGGDVAILDIGCGSGYLRRFLAEAGFAGRYTGIDVAKHPRFEAKQNPRFQSNFVQSTIEEFQTSDMFDLIISMTALEHIENDMLAVHKCRALLKPGGTHVHVIPSFWALFLYLWHGYRQYNPRSIKRLFGNGGGDVSVFRIGGFFSFVLHFFFITIPVFAFGRDKLRKLALYPKLTVVCNRLDRVLPVCPSLYIVVERVARPSGRI